MSNFSRPVASLLCGLYFVLSSAAHAIFPTVYLKPVVLKQIHSPATITYAPDGSGRLFVCDQLGKIYIIQGGMMLPTPFLNIASPSNPPSNGVSNTGPGPVLSVSTGYNERGLLGLAFHPGYANKLSPGYRKFYVNYNKPYVPGSPDFDPPPPVADHTPSCVTVIAEFQVSAGNPNVADPLSERRLLRFTQPQSNHNGGQVEFGPDGYLYFGAGDGGQQDDNNIGHTGGSGAKPHDALGNGQDKTQYLGKIHRIDPIDPDGAGPLTYGIPSNDPVTGNPPGNPFINDPTPGIKKEIWCYGMRNPWRFSFDWRPGSPNPKRLFCGDVGGFRIEEINLIVSGGNYGWRYKEGHEFPTFSSTGSPPMPDPGGVKIDPIAEYAHAGVTTTAPVLPQLGVSVTGGYVYRGSAIPALQGKYVFGDYGVISTTADGRLMGLEETFPGSGVFTLTEALPLFGTANPIPTLHILCFGEDESGEIYIGTKTNTGVLALDPTTTGLPAGGIYKIVPLQTTNASITANKDNTIYSEPNGYQNLFTGYPSDALGYLYAGQTGTNFGPYLRRALISFDVAAQIPAGAIIQSAQLSLRLTKLGPSSLGSPMALHRLTETWGEGTSVNGNDVGFGAQATPGDATWVRRFFDTQSWTTAGGSFSATASAATTVTFPTVTLASTAQMVSDVQGWLNTPAGNAGWILRGDEATENTAVQIASVQKGPTRPTLAVSYQSAPPATRFETWLTTYFPTNQVGQWVDPNGDIDGDGNKNQIEYAYGLSPTTFDATNNFSTALSAAPEDATDLTVTFRRDTAATDLTYKLQTSSDLINWTTIAQSVGGATATGENGGVIPWPEVILSGSIRLVTVRQTLPAGSNEKKFVRLQVDRL